MSRVQSSSQYKILYIYMGVLPQWNYLLEGESLVVQAPSAM